MIEAIIAFSCLSILTSATVGVLYFYFAKVTISDIGYRSLICIAEGQRPNLCKSHALAKIQQRLPVGNLYRYELIKQKNRFSTSHRLGSYSWKKNLLQKKAPLWQISKAVLSPFH